MKNTEDLPPAFTKAELRALAPTPYHYGGYWDNHYHFAKGDYQTGFTHMAVLAEDLTTKNMQFMADRGLTRIFNYE